MPILDAVDEVVLLSNEFLLLLLQLLVELYPQYHCTESSYIFRFSAKTC